MSTKDKNTGSLARRFTETFSSSAKLWQKARKIFPSGVTHDARMMLPFPIYIERAKGAYKWDGEGHQFIDYWVGHGGLILGHRHPVVEEAVSRQLGRGTHYGACHELEIEWGELVLQMVPCAERVRFTSSGTEATLMAVRLARAFTGKEKLIKFEGHFHGWHDNVLMGVFPPYEEPISPGLLQGVVDSCLLSPPNDIEAVERLLSENEDVACIILEPSGASYGTIPTREGFLQELKKLAQKHGVLIVFDEVVTGFRLARGGAQELYGVVPDLTSLAKIVAGGLPGGAVCGRKDIMEYLEFRPDGHWNRFEKIYHPGTFNANPLSASAGIAALTQVRDGDHIEQAAETAHALRRELNDIIDRVGVNWCAYGHSSIFHLMINHQCPKRKRCDFINCDYDYREAKKSAGTDLIFEFRCGMMLGGVDLPGPGGWLSSAHSSADVIKTASAFEETLSVLKEEGKAV
jgi:glutamate-1-semialdehyde 2,1-aminomutase